MILQCKMHIYNYLLNIDLTIIYLISKISIYNILSDTIFMTIRKYPSSQNWPINARHLTNSCFFLCQSGFVFLAQLWLEIDWVNRSLEYTFMHRIRHAGWHQKSLVNSWINVLWNNRISNVDVVISNHNYTDKGCKLCCQSRLANSSKNNTELGHSGQ